MFYDTDPSKSSRTMLVEDGGGRLTYGEFERFYESVSGLLRPGTLMFLLCENSIGAVALYLTCLRRNVVPLLLERNLDRHLLAGLIGTYRPEYLAFPADMEERMCGRGGEGEHGPAEEAAPVASEETERFGYRIFRSEAAHDAAADGLNSELALLLTTSGSTGSPKLVRQSRRNIQSNAAAIAEYLELDETERPITTLPMNYTYGLSVINSHILAGATVLLTKHTLFEREFWDFFRKEGATSIAGVPYTYEMLNRLSFFGMDLPSLRTMTQAGGKLSPALHKKFAEYAQATGRRFIVMYGQTEATARMGYLPAKDALRKCGSMGIAIPGGRFRLMEDEKTEILEADTVGELVYEGENVTMGYAACRADLSKGDERGGILFTGDMAKRDAEGFYYITGRKKRFLKMFGKRVNMDEIEQMLKAGFGEIDVACTGKDDAMRIYAAGADEDFCERAAAWLSEKTGIHPRGIRVLPIEKIPKNEAGKTIYKDLPDDQ